MKNRTRKITLGALLAAIVGVILLMNRQFGGAFDIYLIWVIPIPLILYTAEYGFKDAAAVALATVILSFVLSTPVTVIYTGFSVVLGLAYGYGLYKEKSAYWLLTASVLGSFLMEIVTTYLMADFFGFPIATQIREITEMAAQMKVEIPAAWNLMHILLLMIVLVSVMEGLMIHLLTGILARRLRLKYPQYTVSADMKMPKWFAVISAVLIAAYFILANVRPQEKITEYVMIAMIPAALISLFYGYITAIVWLKIRVNPKSIWWIVVLLILGAPVTFPVLIVLGCFDAFLDFKRKIRYGR